MERVDRERLWDGSPYADQGIRKDVRIYMDEKFEHGKR
jgi:hypothetical protein